MNGLVSFRLCTLTDEELIEKVDSLTDEMYKTGQLHSMHIPARPNADYDLLVGELLMRFRNSVAGEADKQKCNGNCGMNYCDENGCIDIKRSLVDTDNLTPQVSV